MNPNDLIDEKTMAAALYLSDDEPYWPTWEAMEVAAQGGDMSAARTIDHFQKKARKVLKLLQGSGI